MNKLSRYADPVYCIMRLLVGLMFFSHGAQKILGWFPSPRGGGGTLSTLQLVGGWIELLGGLLVAVGLFARIAAFIAAGEMAYAFFFIHTAHAGSVIPAKNGGESAVFYCWFFLFVLFYGAGRWALDSLLFRRRDSFTAATATT